MRRELPRALCVLLALGVVGCLPEEPDHVEPATLPGERAIPRGTFQVIPAELYDVRPAEVAEADLVAAAAGTIIYMNRSGGTYTPGNNDARTNRSSIPDGTATVAAWSASDTMWNQVMTCVRAQFAPFDVDVTDTDPGTVPHIESVVAGRPENLGLPAGVGGVSPFTPDCGIIPNSIVFTFAAALPQSSQLICEVVAQEVSHSFGLDHEYLCTDPMTYLSDCGPKTFQNTAAACGELSARPCRIDGQFDCGTETQNSYMMLAQRVGLKQTGEPVSPVLSIVAPGDGDVVPPGFAITAEATDDVAVVEVEVRIDGTPVATLTEAPWQTSAPASLEPGTHVVEVIARDDSGETAQSVAVELAAGTGPGPGDEGVGGGDEDGDGVPDAEEDGAGTGTIVGGCSAGGGGGGGATTGLFGLIVVLVGLRLRLRLR